MDKGYKRRHYFINKDFQGKFIIQLLAISSVGSIFAVLLFIFFANRKIDSLLYSMMIPSSIFRGNILLKEALWANGIAVVIIAIIFMAVVRRILGKITGPLHDIRNGIVNIGSGNLTSRIVLRSKDEFQDFADGVNNLSTEIHSRFSAIDRRAEKIAALAEELGKFGDAESERIAGLMREISELDQEIGAFRK